MAVMNLQIDKEFADVVVNQLQEELTEERKKVRLQSENAARQLLENRLGEFDTKDILTFQSLLNSDLVSSKPVKNRFTPAFMGHNANQVSMAPDAFNKWIGQLWNAADEDIPALLDEFWKAGEISGAGTSLPTAVLYLKDPSKWGIWVGTLANGVRDIFPGYLSGKARTFEGYRQYNDAYLAIMHQLKISPVFMDIALWGLSQNSESGKDKLFKSLFAEFVDSFVSTPEGTQHLNAYSQVRAAGRQNYADVIDAHEGGQNIDDLVLEKLLPHADTAHNRGRNTWIHIAPTVTRNVRQWFEGAKWARAEDWPVIVSEILVLINNCIKTPILPGGAILWLKKRSLAKRSR